MTAQGAALPQRQNVSETDTGNRLERLFAGLFADTGQAAPEDGELTTQLRRCRNRGDVETLLDSNCLSSRQRGLITTGLRVLEDFFAQPTFHPSLSRPLLDRAGSILVGAMDEDGWLAWRGHALFPLLELIAELALGWHPDHVQAEEVAARMQDWLTRLGGDESPAAVLRAARSWAQRFRGRAARLEQRLREREKGALRLQYASREAARVINRQLAGRQLPRSLAPDLSQVWRPGLQWILLNECVDQSLWNRAVRQLTLLIWSVQPLPDDSRASVEKRRRVTAEVKRQLPELLGQMLPEPGLGERMLEDLQIIWLSLDHDRPVDFVPVPALETGSLLDEAGACVSRDLLAEIGGVSAEDWFEERDSGRRFRLLMKQDQYQELMFVDQAGIKTATVSFEDFAWQLTNGSVVPLGLPARAGELVAERLNMLAQRFREGLERPERASTPAKRHRHETRATPKPRPPQEEQTLPGEVDAGPEAGEDPRRRKWARLLVSGLTLGSWLGIERDGNSLRRKLILILSSTDKYVLVGADGTGRLEYQRADLIRGVADGHIRVLDSDPRYDDTLGRVVDGLQRRNTGG